MLINTDTYSIMELHYLTSTELFQEANSMFNRYSQKGCIFECRLKNTLNHVGCIPWDYPMPLSLINSQHVEMCNSSYKINSGSKLATFENHMNSKESIENCDCLPDCEQQVFETQVS